MPTRKIITESTDGKFIGMEITTNNGEATVDGFTFEVVSETANRITGPNYSVTFEEQT